ncbi:MAG: hypothetical protein SW833_10890 [Cyanobacteriota bacterium]|nr:hypothetical protein [Cyanobacteriota bacterium]
MEIGSVQFHYAGYNQRMHRSRYYLKTERNGTAFTTGHRRRAS